MDEARVFSAEKPIRVLLVDDHEAVRYGLREMLEAEPDIEVVGEAATAGRALARGALLRPDVAVLGTRLPDGNGVFACRELRSRLPALACLLLTSFDDDDALLDALMAGAAGYVLTQLKDYGLVPAVRTVASGRSTLDGEATARLVGRSRRNGSGPVPAQGSGLSPQERDILALVGEGLTDPQIGSRLYLPETAVRTHISRLLTRRGAERGAQAAILAAAFASGRAAPAPPPREGDDPAAGR